METTSETILYFVLVAIDAYAVSFQKGEHWTRCPARPEDGNRPAWEIHNRGIPYDPAEWLDRPLSPAEVKTFSRALEDLERKNLLRRIRSGNRTTHVQLTAAGLTAAIAIEGTAPHLAAIATAFDRIKWAKDLAVAALSKS